MSTETITKSESILRNGMTEKVFTFSFEGKRYYEGINLNPNGGNFGKSTGIWTPSEITQPAQQLTKQYLDPNSELAQRIIAIDGARGVEYRNAMTDIATKAANQGKSKEFDAALEQSGMYNKYRGSESFAGETFPGQAITADTSKEETDGPVEPARLRDTENELQNINETYPVDMQYNNQDYIYIEQFKYLPSNSGINKKGTNEEWSDKLKNTINKGLSRTTNLGEPKGSVRLPIPNKIKSSNGVSWGEAKANAVEAGTFFAAQEGVSDILSKKSNIVQSMAAGFGGLKDVLGKVAEGLEQDGNLSQSGQVLSAVIAKAALGKIGINVDPAQFITRSSGMAINPNMELLFSGPQLRTFVFAFQFAPNDTDEAAVVRKIQRWFKQGMLPVREDIERIYLGSPNVFRLKYKNGNNRIRGLNVFKLCALTACEVDFTPNNVWQSYEDSNAISMPVQSNMALTFTELTPIFGDDYNMASPSQSVQDLELGSNRISSDDIGF